MQNELIKYNGGFTTSDKVLKLIVSNLTQSTSKIIPKEFSVSTDGRTNVSLREYLPGHIDRVRYARVYSHIRFDTNYNKWVITYTVNPAAEVSIDNTRMPGAIFVFDGVEVKINLKPKLDSGTSLYEAFIQASIEQIKQKFPHFEVERAQGQGSNLPSIELSDSTGALKEVTQYHDWDFAVVSEYKEIRVQGPINFIVAFDDSTLFGGELDEAISMPIHTRSPVQIPVVARRNISDRRERLTVGQQSRWAWLPEPFISEMTIVDDEDNEIPPDRYRFNVLSKMIYFMDYQRLQSSDSLYLKQYYKYYPPRIGSRDEENIFDRENKYMYSIPEWNPSERRIKFWFVYWTQWNLIYPKELSNLTNKAVIQSPEIFVELRDNDDNIEIAYGTQLNTEKNGLDPNSSSVFVKIDKGVDNPIRYQMNWSGDFFNLMLNGNYAYCGRLGGSKQYALTATCANFTPTQKWGPKTGNGQTDIIAGQWYQAHYPKMLVVPPQFMNSTATDPNTTEFISPIYVYHDYGKTIGYLQGVAGGHINLGEEGTRFIVDKIETDSGRGYLPVHPLTKQPIYQGQLYVPPPEKEYVQQPLKANNTFFSSLPNQGLTLLFRTK